MPIMLPRHVSNSLRSNRQEKELFKCQPVKVRRKELILASVNVTSKSKKQNKTKQEYNFLSVSKPVNTTHIDVSRGSGSSQERESF